MKRDLNFQFYDPVLLGLQDEIFQGDQPVLAGVDASSIYCYLLAEAEHHDEDTWGIHLLDAKAQGFRTIKSVRFVCYSANPKPHKPTGWAVTN